MLRPIGRCGWTRSSAILARFARASTRRRVRASTEFGRPASGRCDLRRFCDGALCGLAGLEIPQARNKRHKGTLFGVYVCPDRRRAGLGTALVSSVIEHARRRVDQLHAAVVVTAEPARALYRKLGFEPYGLEPRALKVGEEYFDQELLVLRLDGRATPA